MSAFRNVKATEALATLQKRIHDLEVFHEVGKALTQSLEVGVVLRVILEKVSEVIQPTTWSLLLVDELEQELYFKIAVGPKTEGLAGVRLKLGEGIAGHVASTGQALLVEDVRKDTRWSSKADEITHFETRSIVCVPLISQDAVLGVLQLVNFERAPQFTDADLAVLQLFADFAAIAIRNARSMEQIADLSVRDDLTELYNSRYLQTALREQFDQARKDNTPLSIIFLDLDRFKAINDTHGHRVGDDLLREMGQLIGRNLESRAQAMRYGGDEFVILIPSCDREHARRFTATLSDAIAAFPFLQRQALPIELSASIGSASYPEDTTDPEDLIRLADQYVDVSG